jgi:hypothetical protein
MTANLSRDLENRGTHLVDVQRARLAWSVWRQMNGYRADAPILTPPSANQKYRKTKARPTYGVSLAPGNSSGLETCSFRTDNCFDNCVSTAGNGRYDSVTRARQMKTRFLALYPDEFVTLVADEIRQANKRHGRNVAVRLNTFSDLRWEIFAPVLFATFPRVAFYDYTKWTRRETPRNYHLTFSVSEKTTDRGALRMLARFGTIAVVFDTKRGRPLPATFLGAPVIDGDESDARYRDQRGSVIGLRAKGRMIGADIPMIRRAA